MKKILFVLSLFVGFNFYANAIIKNTPLNYFNVLTDDDVIGTWNLLLDWGCDGSADSNDITFHDDYTFTSSSGNYTGTWSSTDNSVTWQHSTGAHAVYTGTISGNTITGTITSDANTDVDCFTATKATASQNDFSDFSFSYYPNPVENVLNLTANEYFNSISIFNLLGQKIMSFSSFNKTNMQLDLSKLMSGVYLIEISKENNKIQTLKIIKK